MKLSVGNEPLTPRPALPEYGERRRPPQRILLASVGSYGDVFPFLALGKELQSRGHDVTLLTSGYFTGLVEQAGLKFAPVGTSDQYKAYVSNPNLLHPLRGLMLTRRMLNSIIEPIYEYLRAEWQDENSMIASSPYCMAARIAEEKLGIQLVTICPAPIAMGSKVDPPAVSTLLSPERVPRSLLKLFGHTVSRVTDHVLGSKVNDFRRALGLKKIHSLMSWWHATRGTISLFPTWFAPSHDDWPIRHAYAGFPVCMPSSLTDIPTTVSDERLEQFLSQSKPPLLFYPGSNAGHLRRYFDICSQACRELGRTGIVVAPAAMDLNDRQDAHMFVLPFVSMGRTLPCVDLVIHHGGIGTIAACLSAGVPQLIRPMFADQPDNATRVARLGVGSWLPASRFQVSQVVRTVKHLIHDPQIRSQCLHYRDRMKSENGLTNAADLVETYAS